MMDRYKTPLLPFIARYMKPSAHDRQRDRKRARENEGDIKITAKKLNYLIVNASFKIIIGITKQCST